jgi:hypothetical protein
MGAEAYLAGRVWHGVGDNHTGREQHGWGETIAQLTIVIIIPLEKKKQKKH